MPLWNENEASEIPDEVEGIASCGSSTDHLKNVQTPLRRNEKTRLQRYRWCERCTFIAAAESQKEIHPLQPSILGAMLVSGRVIFGGEGTKILQMQMLRCRNQQVVVSDSWYRKMPTEKKYTPEN